MRNGSCNDWVQKETAMTNGARKTPSSPLIAHPFGYVEAPPADDERSSIRSRDGEAPLSTPERKAARRSDPELSLDQRMEKKMLLATSMLAKLDPRDTRARLLHIAVLRRDETLIDGVLAELGITGAPTRAR
jgi:hypothetical protein